MATSTLQTSFSNFTSSFEPSSTTSMVQNDTRPSPSPIDAGLSAGEVTGVVISVLLVVAVGLFLLLVAKRKGWITINRNTFHIPKLGRKRPQKSNDQMESSTYVGVDSPNKISSPAKSGSNLSYEVCLPVTSRNGNKINKPEKRISGSDRPYLEIIAEPASAPSYENVNMAPVMKTISCSKRTTTGQNAKDNSMYVNYGSDIDNDEVEYYNSEIFPGTSNVDTSDQTSEIYTNVPPPNEHCNETVGKVDNGNEENYFILDENPEREQKTILPETSPGGGFESQDNYFVLEAETSRTESEMSSDTYNVFEEVSVRRSNARTECPSDQVYSKTSDFGTYNTLNEQSQESGPCMYDRTSKPPSLLIDGEGEYAYCLD